MAPQTERFSNTDRILRGVLFDIWFNILSVGRGVHKVYVVFKHVKLTHFVEEE